ncbi:hypothetical protein HJC23_011511 [Cyclotella cryptica]|uniref:Poly(A) RNA polymerase mitochondrial-like central palm domain-containing protein n=1 Tax=Cyclotella cryptica TaxID=29204 RepID=A0ABD3NS06_9STRA
MTPTAAQTTSARSWFASLPTDEQRAAASSITDPVFLVLFLDLAREEGEHSSLWDTHVVVLEFLVLTVPPPPPPYATDAATAPSTWEGIAARYDAYMSRVMERRIVSDDAAIDSKREAMDPNDGAGKDAPETKVPANNAEADAMKPVDRMPNDATTESGMETMENTIVSLPSAGSDGGEDNLSNLLNLLISHVYAILPASFSNDADEVRKMINGDVTSNGKSPTQDKKDATASSSSCNSNNDSLNNGGVAALTLDPSTLGTSGESNLFCNLADQIVSLMGTNSSSGTGEENGEEAQGEKDAPTVPRFLTEQSSRDCGLWPRWIDLSSKDEDGDLQQKKKTSLGILLLAGFEMSIEASYQRWLRRNGGQRQQQQTSTLQVGEVMFHMGEESALHTVWQSSSSESNILPASELNADTKLTEDIEQIFRFRKTLAEDGDKVLTLLSPEDLTQLESNFQNREAALKAEHLLMTPLQWILSSSSAVLLCLSLNDVMMGIWTKTRSLLAGGGKGSQKEEGTSLMEDVESIGEVFMSQSKKQKKKKKKKHKRKPLSHDAHSKAKVEKAEPTGPPSTPVAKVELGPSIVVADGDKYHEESAKSPVDDVPLEVNERPDSDEKKSDSPDPLPINNSSDPSPTDNCHNPPPIAITTSEAESIDLPSEEKIETGSPEPNPVTNAQQEATAEDDADESAWETVPAKTRKPKVKPPTEQPNNKSSLQNRSSQSGRNNAGAPSTGDGGNSTNTRKGKRRKDRDRGKRHQTKVVKDVLTHILDAVDDQVARRVKQGAKSVSSDDRRRPSTNDKRSVSSNNRSHGNSDQRRKAAPVPSSTNSKQPRTMRDVVVGAVASPAKSNVKVPNGAPNKAKLAAEPTRGSKIKPGLSYKSVIEPTRQPAVVTPSPVNGTKAPDVKVNRVVEHQIMKDKIIAGDSDGNVPSNETPVKSHVTRPAVENETKVTSAKEDSCRTPLSATDDERNNPPLSTLLGPGTSCSATSSVASSLEAPHSSRFRHQSISTTEDVGVHLLNVCRQLSEEIDTFMSRRSHALNVRRKERSAVLGALQDTLRKIWPGSCHVEMYGSCATQLDLPSSDLDLVVCGLDEIIMNHIPIEQTSNSTMKSPTNSTQTLHQSPANSVQNLRQSFDNSAHNLPHSPGETTPQIRIPSNQEFESSHGEPAADQMTDFAPEGEHEMVYDASEEDVTMGMESYNPDYHSNQQEYYYVPYNYIPPISLNAQRVIRLASELEMQPWAVQVKAIPTAAVPVVKMLADPSRLPGAVGNGSSWMIPQHIAAQAGAPCSPPLSPDQIPVAPNQFFQQGQASSSHFFSQHSMPAWRGADIMNGLQPVDITFEGPEHGGIGSTTYSACVVQEACNETGLPPESTPVVQVAMVLKELLAQRRLNEPFSGGLSSYALLLLLLAVMKERRIIQEEMERVEKQRQEVSRLDGDSKLSQMQNNTGTRMSTALVNAGKNTAPKSEKRKVEEVPPAVAPPSNGKVIVDKIEEPSNMPSKQIATSSWASIAKKSNGSTTRTDSTSTTTISNSSAMAVKNILNEKNRAFPSSGTEETKNASNRNAKTYNAAAQSGSSSNSAETESEPTQCKITNTLPQSKVTVEGQVTQSTEEDAKLRPPLIPQCSNDVLEVLCSGELTSGKLLMHFLLFYGQHFDAQSTLIDINGTHHPEYGRLDIDKLSPFVARPPGGTIDPVTGMYSVDPIVVYDPLEGAMDHNVAKRCYCWNNVRWVFAQCYMTVSSVVETSGTSTKTAAKVRHRGDPAKDGASAVVKSGDSTPKEQPGTNSDLTTPILELLLSF